MLYLHRIINVSRIDVNLTSVCKGSYKTTNRKILLAINILLYQIITSFNILLQTIRQTSKKGGKDGKCI